MIEEFRQTVVDRTVIGLVNKRFAIRQVARGTTRERVLQVLIDADSRPRKGGCKRFDPWEGTAKEKRYTECAAGHSVARGTTRMKVLQWDRPGCEDYSGDSCMRFDP